AGGADSALVAEMKRNFASVKHAKPPASRKDSSEWYVVAQGFKGGAKTPGPDQPSCAPPGFGLRGGGAAVRGSASAEAESEPISSGASSSSIWTRCRLD